MIDANDIRAAARYLMDESERAWRSDSSGNVPASNGILRAACEKCAMALSRMADETEAQNDAT